MLGFSHQVMRRFLCTHPTKVFLLNNALVWFSASFGPQSGVVVMQGELQRWGEGALHGHAVFTLFVPSARSSVDESPEGPGDHRSQPAEAVRELAAESEYAPAHEFWRAHTHLRKDAHELGVGIENRFVLRTGSN